MRWHIHAIVVLALLHGGTVQAQDSVGTDGLARAAQNPIADLISLPFQNSTNFNVGPNSHIQNVLNIQPVIPFRLGPDWNLITRTILPLISQPGLGSGEGTTFGLGATQLSLFASPRQPLNGIIWGAGIVGQLPTTTDPALGSNRWGLGPGVVALTIQGPWVLGGLVNNVWALDGGGTRTRYNVLTAQPFVNYNFRGGTYLTSSPIISANWEVNSGDRWTVPVGGGVGQIFKIGEQPVNAQVGAYYNVVRPDFGPEWSIRVQLQLLFPK